MNLCRLAILSLLFSGFPLGSSQTALPPAPQSPPVQNPPLQNPPLQAPPPPPVTAPVQVSPAETSPGQNPQPSEPYRDRVRRQGPVLNLTVPEAIEMALRANLDIVIEKTNVDTANWGLIGAKGFYDPILSFSVNKSSSPSLNIQPQPVGMFSPISPPVISSGFSPSASFNFFTGGSLNVSLSDTRTFTGVATALNSSGGVVNPTGGTLNPIFGASLNITFSQPLLRGVFGGSSGVHQIRIAKYGVTLSHESFRQRVITVVQSVLQGYFELLFAIENYEAKRNSRDLAVIQFENTRLRVQSGLLAGSSLTAARSEVFSREQDWISSEVTIVNNQNALRALLSADRSSPVWKAALLPVTQPETGDPTLTLEESLASARAHRPELSLILLQQQQNFENTRYAANNRLPQVNFTGSLTATGQSGIVVGELPPDVDPATGTYLGGYNAATSQALLFNAPGWSLGINVQLPIRNRSLESAYAQSKIADRRLEAQHKSTLLSVESNVVNTWESLVIQKNNLKAAGLSLEAARVQLEAITARFEANLSTNFEVLSYQRDLAAARVLELRARIDYQEALFNLQVASGRLLEANHVILPPAP